MTSTISLNAALRTKASKRGFSIIEIPRERGIVQKDKIKISDYQIETGQIKKIETIDLESLKIIL